MSISSIGLAPMEALLERLEWSANRRKNISFLVGSALTAPSGGNPGVPDVDGIIAEIRRALEDAPQALARFNAEIGSVDGAARYQAAWAYFRSVRDQDAVNNVVRRAVLAARKVPYDLDGAPRHELLSAEQDPAGWHVSDGVHALAHLHKQRPDVFDGPILTTNFDPLLEVGLRASGQPSLTVDMDRDGRFSNVRSDGCVSVVHIHGSWLSDTMHTGPQLTAHRPKLVAELTDMLQSRTIVAVAYSGWDDAFTQALLQVQHAKGPLDLIWCFFEQEAAVIKGRYARLMERLQESIAPSRVAFYCGVDCNKVFRALVQRVAARPALGAATATSGAPTPGAPTPGAPTPGAPTPAAPTPAAPTPAASQTAPVIVLVNPFQTGALPAGHPTYVHRRCDDEMDALLGKRRLVAVMGEQGTGKSSLLNQVAQRYPTGWAVFSINLMKLRIDRVDLFIDDLLKEFNCGGCKVTTWGGLADVCNRAPTALILDEFGAMLPFVAKVVLPQLLEVVLDGSRRVQLVSAMLTPVTKYIHDCDIINDKYTSEWRTVTLNAFDDTEADRLFSHIPDALRPMIEQHRDVVLAMSKRNPRRMQRALQTAVNVANDALRERGSLPTDAEVQRLLETNTVYTEVL